MTTTIQLSDDAFAALFRPKANHLVPDASFDFGDGLGTLFETYGNELDFIQAQDSRFVWTLLDGDEGDFIVSGAHRVNRNGYFITENPVPDGVEIEVPIGTHITGLTSADRTAIAEVLNYLAGKGLDFGRCENSAVKEHPIGEHCEILRQILGTEPMETPS